MSKETHIGEALLRGPVEKKLVFQLRDKTIKPEHLSDSVGDYVKNKVNGDIKNLQNQIDSLEVSGIALSDKFGQDPHIGMSQKAISEAIQDINRRIANITGEELPTLNVSITPSSFWDDSVDLQITATPTFGKFDSVKIYINDTLAGEADICTSYTVSYTATDTITVRVEALIYGEEFIQDFIVPKVSGNCIIGGGATLNEVLESGVRVIYEQGKSAVAEVTFEEGDYLWAALSTTADVNLKRLVMGGFDIPMETQYNSVYKVYKSLNTYNSGTYTIYII